MAHVTDFKEAGFNTLLEELEWRGLISQSTDRDRLAEALNGEPITYYCGFDPTAASLHIGNLVQLINMRHLQLAGHHPIALVGGATGLIGDPRQSGERTLNPKDVVAGWADRLKNQIGGILDTEGANAVRFVSNYDWTASMTVIDFLRDVGKNFRLGTMLAKDTAARREEMLAEIYNALCILYGQPPRSFDFEYTDKDEHYHCERNLTPHTFLEKYVGNDLDDYVVIISSPIHALNRTYCQPFMGDVVEENMFWLNLSQEELEDLTIRQLQAGEGVMFSCDCHPDGDRANGYWDPDCFQYGEVLGGLTFGMTKAERLLTRESTMNHCMMFCGVNLDENGKADRWKIENSWGDASGQKGYYIGSEKWFKANVYQITVRKSLLSDAQRALLDQEPLPMKLWDPLA